MCIHRTQSCALSIHNGRLIKYYPPGHAKEALFSRFARCSGAFHSATINLYSLNNNRIGISCRLKAAKKAEEERKRAAEKAAAEKAEEGRKKAAEKAAAERAASSSTKKSKRGVFKLKSNGTSSAGASGGGTAGGGDDEWGANGDSPGIRGAAVSLS